MTKEEWNRMLRMTATTGHQMVELTDEERLRLQELVEELEGEPVGQIAYCPLCGCGTPVAIDKSADLYGCEACGTWFTATIKEKPIYGGE